jgi:membrane protein required for colicin V production
LILLVLVVMAGLTGLDQAPWWQEARSAMLLSDWVELKPLLPQELGRHLPA